MTLVREMNPAEARVLTERIKSQAEQLWRLLLEAHERKAYKALGYAKWTDYVTAEFHIGHSRSYQILDQAKVIRAIEAASGVQDPGHFGVNSEAASDIKPRLAEVTDEIRERIDRGEDPEEAVRETVATARKAARPEGRTGRAWTKNASRTDKQVAQIIQGLSVVAESIVTFDPGNYRATPEEVEGLDRIIKSLRQFRKALTGE